MQTSFRDLDIATLYGPGVRSPIQFYAQVLPASKHVSLGLGYFASTAFEALAQSFRWWSDSIPSFSLIVNDQFAPSDLLELQNEHPSTESPSQLSVERFREMWHAMAERKQRGYEFLRFLLEEDRLELRLAVAKSGGIVHHKFALFEDSSGDRIVTHGSLNFSASALLKNVETMHAVRSWETDASGSEIAQYYTNLFENLWSNQQPEVSVFSGGRLIEALQDVVPRRGTPDFIEITDYSNSDLESDTDGLSGNIATLLAEVPPPNQELRDYQQDAVVHWYDKKYRDLWAMATGTGKTFTAIQAVRFLVRKEQVTSLLLVVVVPSTVLVDQWADELGAENFAPVILAVGSFKQWETSLIRGIRTVTHARGNVAVVATHDAYKRHVSIRLGSVADRTMLVVDEVHTIGTSSGLASLPKDIPWRLGLSATPIRQYDDDGTSSLLAYFDSEAGNYYRYSIAQAVESGYLCPYVYEPQFVELTESETEQYADLSAKIATMINSDDPEIKAVCNQLLMKRHRIIERAENKLGPTAEAIERISEQNRGRVYGIVYSPDGDFPIEDQSEVSQQWIDVIMDHIGRLDARAHRFVQGTPLQVLSHMANAHLDWVVAKKRLDEGVDIPRAEHAIIVASSRTLRQYVQRRGRVLRPHPEKTHAHIIDFVVVPGTDGESTPPFAQALLRQELSRLKEFVSAASNRDEIENRVRKIADLYDVSYDDVAAPGTLSEASEYEALQDDGGEVDVD